MGLEDGGAVRRGGGSTCQFPSSCSRLLADVVWTSAEGGTGKAEGTVEVGGGGPR